MNNIIIIGLITLLVPMLRWLYQSCNRLYKSGKKELIPGVGFQQTLEESYFPLDAWEDWECMTAMVKAQLQRQGLWKSVAAAGKGG